MMELITNPNAWIALLTLTFLEIILGIDNIVFLSIVSGKLPEKEQPKSGAPKVDMAQVGKLAQMLGKGSKLPMQKGKDVTTKPPETHVVKPDPKVTEKFTPF